jgi:BCCT family betaine/carnitine transporter
MSLPSDQADSDAALGAEPIREPEGRTEVIETSYEIGQDNIARSWTLTFDIHQVVFTVSALAVIAFTFFTMAFQNELEPIFVGLRNWLTASLDWFFLLAGNVFVLLCLVLIVTPLGRVRLGGPQATPDYSYVSWFAMLFAAGMGIGLMFYGVSEPLGHFSAAFDGVTYGEDGVRTDWAPLGGAEGDPIAARRLGMAATIFHWGLHPWAIYAVVALALALFPSPCAPASIRSSANGSGAGLGTSSTSSPFSPRSSGWPLRSGSEPSKSGLG